MVLEATDYTYIALLIEKWSSSVENLKDEPQAAGFFTSSNWPGYYEILAMMLQLIDLETAKLQSSDQKDIDAFEGYEVVATLNMAINMLRSSEHKIVKVFVAWSPGKPAFYMRIMQKIMLMFGHNKKADARPSIKTLTDATERILAKLYDVMGALMELPDSGSLVQEIIEGHDFRGQLMKYMNCVLEDDDHSRPIAMAGALRLALVILKSYQHREDPPGEAISSQVITALNEMRSLVDCLSMKGPTFDNLWQVCGGDEVPPRPRELTHPVVLENFEAIVKLVSFFSQQEGPLYAESRRVVGGNREELMFQLITVPNAKLKDAALQCLSSASVADTSASEMESLIGLLDVKGQELQSSFTYLERIMSQLNKMLTAQSGYGALLNNLAIISQPRDARSWWQSTRVLPWRRQVATRRCTGATQLKATFPKHAQTAPADTARGSLRCQRARSIIPLRMPSRSWPMRATCHPWVRKGGTGWPLKPPQSWRNHAPAL